MPNRPEMVPTITPGNPGNLQDALYAISRFLGKPPGIARVTYDSGSAEVSIQATNRVGLANQGQWVVLVMGLNAAGVPITLGALTPTVGSILATLPGSLSYLGLTDVNGRLVFNVSAPPSAGQKVAALVVGEPDLRIVE